MLKGAFVGGLLVFSVCFAAYGLKGGLIGLAAGAIAGAIVGEIAG